ncbi:MAG: hypothetical protein ACOCQG_06455 [Candidatus Nanoarchaeia archaeon]
MYESIKKTKHSPTLKTILMVEEVLKDSQNSLISIAEIKRTLPRQVNHNTLMQILQYLEESNKIAVSMYGITWIHNSNPNVRRIIAEGIEI